MYVGIKYEQNGSPSRMYDNPITMKKDVLKPKKWGFNQQTWIFTWSTRRWVDFTSEQMDSTNQSWDLPTEFGIWDVILPIDELHHFSRCFFNHQPVIETNHPTIIQPTTSHRSTEKRGRPGGLNIGDGTHVRQLIAPTTKSWRSPKEKRRTLTGKNRLQGRFGWENLPSGKHTKNYGKSPFLMGKLTINGHVQ